MGWSQIILISNKILLNYSQLVEIMSFCVDNEQRSGTVAPNYIPKTAVTGGIFPCVILIFLEHPIKTYTGSFAQSNCNTAPHMYRHTRQEDEMKKFIKFIANLTE